MKPTIIIYIAGKMTGLPDLGREKFNAAEKWLRELGYNVLNPACLPVGLPSKCYMPICLAMLEQADGILLLDGWEDSPGAQIEKAYADYQGKDIFYGRVEYLSKKEEDKA